MGDESPCPPTWQKRFPMRLQVCEAADDAPWRSQRLTTQQLLEREWTRGKRVSPIFSVFGVFNHLFKCDWMHCADQGIAADFLGESLRVWDVVGVAVIMLGILAVQMARQTLR